MIYTILESIRYTLTLLFGIFVSVLFLDIRINKKNVICVFLFFYICLLYTSDAADEQLYV